MGQVKGSLNAIGRDIIWLEEAVPQHSKRDPNTNMWMKQWEKHSPEQSDHWRAEPSGPAGDQWPVLPLALSSPYYHITDLSPVPINCFDFNPSYYDMGSIERCWNEKRVRRTWIFLWRLDVFGAWIFFLVCWFFLCIDFFGQWIFLCMDFFCAWMTQTFLKFHHSSFFLFQCGGVFGLPRTISLATAPKCTTMQLPKSCSSETFWI